MSLINTLPIELENIINDYKYQMEHKEKFKSSLDKINQIIYVLSVRGDSIRYYGITSVITEINTDNTLSVLSIQTSPPDMNGDSETIETTTTIYESIDNIEIEIVEDEYVISVIDIDDLPEDFRINQ